MRQALLLFALISSAALFSQQINTQVGRVSTTFDYKDSEGEKLEDLYPDNGFSYAVGYRMPLTDRIFVNADLIYNTYSSFGSDELYGNSYSWRTEYFGLSAGVEGEVWKKRSFTLLARADVDPQLMTKGTQLINEQAYDLKGVEQFDKPMIFYRGGIGVNFCAETSLALSLKYMYGIGSGLGSSKDSERFKMRTSTISIGVLWNFRACTYCKGRR